MRNKELERTLADVRIEGDPNSTPFRGALERYFEASSHNPLNQSVPERVNLAIERLARAAQAFLRTPPGP